MAQPTEPTSMTILELTRLLSAQDDRWASILTYAQSTHNPAAPAGIAFFKRTWRPVMSDYYLNIVSQYDSAAKAPSHVVRWVLDKMSNVVYPAARKIGLPETSFVIPDITIDKSAPPTTVAGDLWVRYAPWQYLYPQKFHRAIGADPKTDARGGVGDKIAFAGIGIIFLGIGVYALNAHQLAKMPS